MSRASNELRGRIVELTTRRFLLRDFNDTDSDAFEAYHSDPRSHEFYGTEHTTTEYARKLLELFRAWAAEQPRVNFQLAIIRRGDPQILVGCCGLRSGGEEKGTAELGIELAPEYWGRYAYATEVMHALVEFGFGTLNLHTIYGGTVSANSRIARLVNALGATAIIRPSPEWMRSKGWSNVEWRITRDQWANFRLTSAGTRGEGHERE
ncbi:GNAT family N-acetyltransferase [Marinobacter sp. DUT-3]|uniref:GNAT family N-acetyltransferase n=1 Tax=Marinobacter sp. DUT-3 TaxID=3412036 RepID=UPI003D17C61A